MEATHFSETSVFIKTARLDIPENGSLHSHGRQNLKSYRQITDYSVILH
jgi:hypothetical protein